MIMKECILKSEISIRISLLPSLLALSIAAGGYAAEDQKWFAPASEVCFSLRVESRPTDPEAGVVAIVPDCGLLPKNQFKPEVFSEDGKPLKCEVVWHNPKEGLAVVFEAPGGDTCRLYVSPSSEKTRFASAFKPSILLYVRNGTASLEQARALAEKPPVGSDIYFAHVDRIFHSISPAGRDENASSYYSAWFKARRPGRTYFYTSSKDGSEFLVDGKLGYSWPGIHGRDMTASKGQWIEISSGLHHIEYFHFNLKFDWREAHLGWQLPGEKQPFDPQDKTKTKPNLDVTGPMVSSDFILSGRARLERASSRRGPLALFDPAWESIIEPGNAPVCLFKFEPAAAGGLPESAVCSWDFSNGRIIKGRQAYWLFGGYGEQHVTLTATMGAYASSVTRSFFPKSPDPANEPPRVSVFTPEGRAQYRGLYQVMVEATPPNHRPCEDWNETMWEGFYAVLDSETDPKLIYAVAERSAMDIRRASRDLALKIEDRIIELARRSDPRRAMALCEIFEKSEKDRRRLVAWKSVEMQIALYELNDLSLARRLLDQISPEPGDARSTALKMVRAGDLERFGNNIELARRHYQAAQSFYASNAPPRQAREEESATNAASKVRAAGDANKPISPAAKPRPAAFNRTGMLAQSISDWKVRAVQEAGYYATVQSLIDQDSIEEARAVLDEWELEFPLTKLSGDYPVAEALYYIAVRNFRAAVGILSNYRRVVEISNELPRAMRMELYCLTQLGDDKAARAFARGVIERLPRHALAEEIKTILARDENGPLTIDFDIHTRAWTSTEKVDGSVLGRLFSTNQVIMIREEPVEE